MGYQAHSDGKSQFTVSPSLHVAWRPELLGGSPLPLSHTVDGGDCPGKGVHTVKAPSAMQGNEEKGGIIPYMVSQIFSFL